MNNDGLIYGNPGSPTTSLKSTLISLVPFAINEFKPGLIPGQFDVPACEDIDTPVCHVIGESIYFVYIDKDRGSLRVVDPSYKVAQSIVNDYNAAQLGAKPECHPGFFWEIGEHTSKSIKDKFPDKLIKYREIQRNWFVELVKLADDDWEKTRQHYSISDMQRYALKSIDPKNSKMRPWVIENPLAQPAHADIDITLCPACGSDIPQSVIICRYCRCILDQERYNKMLFAGGEELKPTPKFDLSKVPGVGRA